MNTAEYLTAVVRVVLVVAPAFVGARSWRRLLAPHWTGALALLADSVGALSGVIMVSEILGSSGGFRRDALLPTLVILALASRWWCRRRATRPTLQLTSSHSRTPDVLQRTTNIAIVASSAALMCAQWSSWIATRFHTGIGNFAGPGDGDSLWYHMPLAAAFVQSGWTTHIQFTNGEALTAYYPANTSILHALGLLTLGNDSLSIFVNFGLALMALLAGWCIGEGYGVGSMSTAAVALALATPVVVATEAGTAKDDVLGLFGLLAAVAFVVHPSATTGNEARWKANAAYGGLAAGLALGSKLTLVAPVAVLIVTLWVLMPRAFRTGFVVRFGISALATSSYWYLRNLFTIGNPLPGLSIGLGHFHLPRPSTPSITLYGADLLHVILNASIWRSALIPGLGFAFGPTWPLILAIMGVTIVVGIATLRGQQLIPPITAALALGAFVITPGTVWAPQLIPSHPSVNFVTTNLFSYNLRYMLPALAIGLAVVPLVAVRWRHGPLVVAGALGAVLAATEIGRKGPVSLASGWVRGFPLITIAAGVAVFAIATAILAKNIPPSGIPIGHAVDSPPKVKRPRRRRIGVWLVALVSIGAVGLPVQHLYLTDRYKTQPVAQFAATLNGARIGYSGFVYSYPLYGARLQNYVQMIGAQGPDGSWHPMRTCIAWRQEIQADHLQYVVVPVGGTQSYLGIDLARWKVGLPTGIPPLEPPESRWTRNDPGAKVVFAAAGIAAYSVHGPATSRDC